MRPFLNQQTKESSMTNTVVISARKHKLDLERARNNEEIMKRQNERIKKLERELNLVCANVRGSLIELEDLEKDVDCKIQCIEVLQDIEPTVNATLLGIVEDQ